MIIKEFYMQREDGVNLIKTFSDKNFMIQKTGTSEIYNEAIDIESAIFEYVETTEKFEPVSINKEPQEETESTEEIIENGDQELTQEEIATMLEEVF